MGVSPRDLDLVVGGLLIAIATGLAQLHDPALAIAVLSLIVAVALMAIGDDGLEHLWRAYCREPARAPEPKRRELAPVRATRAVPVRGAPRCTTLAPARVVTRGVRAY